MYSDFLPGSGKLEHIRLPRVSDTVRVDTGVVEGDEVSIFYDPMIAKLIAHGADRDQALDNLVQALHEYQIVGLPTNIEFVARTANHPEFRKGGVDTSFLNKFGDTVLEPLGDFPEAIKALGAVSLLAIEQLKVYPLAAFNGELESPWSDPSLTHFRALDTHERRFSMTHEHGETSVSVKSVSEDKYEVSLRGDDGGEVTLNASGSIDPSGNFEFRVESRKYKGTAVIHQQNLHVFCDDGTERYDYVFHVPPPAFDSGEVTGGEGHAKITTPMPGKIIKVLVQAGDDITAEQPLLIMEAMKMEHVIRATKDAKVGELFCAEGDFVTDNQVLIELD